MDLIRVCWMRLWAAKIGLAVGVLQAEAIALVVFTEVAVLAVMFVAASLLLWLGLGSPHASGRS